MLNFVSTKEKNNNLNLAATVIRQDDYENYKQFPDNR